MTPQGDNLTLDCGATGNPSPTVLWFKDSDPLPNNGRISVSPNGLLTFTSLYSTDEGSYTCIVSNSVGSTSANTVLTVLGKSFPQLHSVVCSCGSCPLVIPVIHAGIVMVTVDEGDTAVLDCNATGNPIPTVSWFHFSSPVPVPGDTRIRQADNDSLIVTDVSADDEGVYVCEASNIAGSETATLELSVNGE